MPTTISQRSKSLTVPSGVVRGHGDLPLRTLLGVPCRIHLLEQVPMSARFDPEKIAHVERFQSLDRRRIACQAVLDHNTLVMFTVTVGTGLGTMAAVWLSSRRLFDHRERLRMNRLRGA